MAFEYEIILKTESQILQEKIFDNLGLIVTITLNPLDGKVHIQSEEELSVAQLADIKAILAEAGRA
jgi:hypothetical protein